MLTYRRSGLLTGEELDALLKKGPAESNLFLTARTSAESLAEALSALANSHGGYVLLGVTQRGTPQKEIDLDELRERAVEAGLLTEPPLILPSAQIVESGKGPVVVIHVPSGLPHIYSLHGRYLTRIGAYSRPLTTPELRRLLFERADAGFEETPVNSATIEDLDTAQIERYLSQIDAAPQEDPLQQLLARGCVAATETGYMPTAAGMLLFGQDPQRFFRSAEIICVRYTSSDMSDEFMRQDITGTLPEQLRQSEAFVSSNMRRGMKLTGITREEMAEYPLPVVREAIVNAVAHRDYSIRGEGIRVIMYSDRLEVYSPGRLPGHVTLENLREERYSRNEAIVAVLSDLGYIERLGYGIDRMVAAMSAQGLPEPEFAETAAGFRVTLGSGAASLVSSRPLQQPGEHAFLNPRQEIALAHVQAEGRITNSDYQTLVPDVSPETIRRDLADLVDKDILIKIGAKRATYYILK